MPIRTGQLVRKRSNDYANYIVTSMRNGKARLDTVNGYYVPEQSVLYPKGYPVEKLIGVEYKTLPLSKLNMYLAKVAVAKNEPRIIYVDIRNTYAQQIDLHLNECNIVKVYSTDKNGGFYFIAIDEIKHVIAGILINDKLVKKPCFKIMFHPLK